MSAKEKLLQEKHLCPACKSKPLSGTAHKAGMQERQEIEIPCQLCKGTGGVTDRELEYFRGGQRARRYREDHGLGLREAADQWGIKASTLSDTENGLLDPSSHLEYLHSAQLKSLGAAPYEPIRFELSKGRVVQVTLDEDKDEVIVHLVGRKCGELLVIPSANNAIRLRPSGDGM